MILLLPFIIHLLEMAIKNGKFYKVLEFEQYLFVENKECFMVHHVWCSG